MSRPIGRTLGRRLGIDLALVVLAGIGLWQLRLYGAPLTRNVRGVLGVDPLLVAAPAIGLIAGALLAPRAVPRLAEVAQPLLERGRGLVGSIGGRAVARRPLRYTRSALLLMLAAALGTFSVADVATWTRSQSDQAAYQAGADVRIIGSNSGSVDATALGPAYPRLPGVTEAMPVDRYSVDSRRSVGGATLLAADLPSGGRYGIQAIEVTVAPNGPFGVSGTIEITNVETSPATAGESWTTLNGFPAAGAAWTWPGQGDGPATFHPRSDHPLELRFRAEPGRIVPPSGFGGSIPVRLAWLPVVGAIPVVASRPFLTLTSADVGDQLPATIQGTPIQVAIVAAIDEFPTLDPAKPFLIADGGTVAIARFNAAGAVTHPGEGWLATSDSGAADAGGPL